MLMMLLSSKVYETEAPDLVSIRQELDQAGGGRLDGSKWREYLNSHMVRRKGKIGWNKLTLDQFIGTMTIRLRDLPDQAPMAYRLCQELISPLDPEMANFERFGNPALLTFLLKHYNPRKRPTHSHLGFPIGRR